MPKFQIYQRQDGEHREQHFALFIDEQDADVTCDPAQFAEVCLAELLEEGHTPEQAAALLTGRCQARAQHAFERKVERLQQGRGKSGVFAGTAAEAAARKLPSATKTIETFLNRGALAGLTKLQRKERMDRRHRKNRSDPQGEWRANRAAMIARVEAELKEWQAKLPAGGWQPRYATELPPKAVRRTLLLQEQLERLKMPIVAATHGFQYAFGQYLTAGVNFVSGDIRVIPLMTNTTVDTERDAKDQFSDFTTVDVYDGTNASANGLALDNQAVNIDDANDRAEFDADDETETALGACTRSLDGECLFLFNTNLNSSMPLHWLEYAVDKTPDGSDFVHQYNAEGILQAA